VIISSWSACLIKQKLCKGKLGARQYCVSKGQRDKIQKTREDLLRREEDWFYLYFWCFPYNSDQPRLTLKFCVHYSAFSSESDGFTHCMRGAWLVKQLKLSVYAQDHLSNHSCVRSIEGKRIPSGQKYLTITLQFRGCYRLVLGWQSSSKWIETKGEQVVK